MAELTVEERDAIQKRIEKEAWNKLAPLVKKYRDMGVPEFVIRSNVDLAVKSMFPENS